MQRRTRLRIVLKGWYFSFLFFGFFLSHLSADHSLKIKKFNLGWLNWTILLCGRVTAFGFWSESSCVQVERTFFYTCVIFSEAEIRGGGPKPDFIVRIILTQIERLFLTESHYDSTKFNTGNQTRISIYTDKTEIDKRQREILSWKQWLDLFFN